ncbi:hypothetical protein C5167_028100 [Papaver somniferum]|uniref:uncharacterized protein LOC113331767 isoform X1 n=1 Tax=Papaver somniferum TaxID=3469 RepID=UPI000E701589|nr:uncharacterized protein LOC113331767 isoform X1 [Papaver somniferum]XP_026434192.1 uncharacterized protein LOC113331767 isoform X1 [Papaver somniferum]RZC87653.1 hypothetical protein C5167_028100 [Papaver somniferum]
MLSAMKLHVSNPTITSLNKAIDTQRKIISIKNTQNHISFQPLTNLNNNNNNQSSKLLQISSISLQSDSPSLLTSSIGSPSSSSVPVIQLNLTNRHILVLNAIACLAAVSTCWLCFSAIPALLAFRRAAESIEKLLDDAREELPDTMAAVRLSGMEISDLTMELSDLGQEITQGVRRSTRAVRVAEDRIRSFTNIKPTALIQEQASQQTKTTGPPLATSARGVREGIVKGRQILQSFFSFTQFSKMALTYFAMRGKKP